MRLFVAIELDRHVKSGIQEVVDRLSAVHKNAKFVEPENLHFTVKFLGEVRDDRLEDVKKAISASVSGFRPFKVTVKGLGYFGNRKAAGAVWVGAEGGHDEMVRLASRLEAGLSKFRKEERQFSAHITICRPNGDTSKLIDDIEQLGSKDFGSMEVRSIKLKKSTLTPRGPVYDDVGEFALPI